jgi:hypothetical protein
LKLDRNHNLIAFVFSRSKIPKYGELSQQFRRSPILGRHVRLQILSQSVILTRLSYVLGSRQARHGMPQQGRQTDSARDCSNESKLLSRMNALNTSNRERSCLPHHGSSTCVSAELEVFRLIAVVAPINCAARRIKHFESSNG